jgi:hypothetical protein
MACGDGAEVGAAGILTSPCCCDHRKKEVELLRSCSWPWLMGSAEESKKKKRRIYDGDDDG